ncbi:hypothetical protein P154DRAFT_435018 [Amniculicola lignicola CBS 123094]|uniref:Rhodopsin domain-containing protein n=1 Tax=Amniculicola lignicola CBS 123094 TaxID=1392246 RepID=A0A6A5WG37_9PLEO|nr:hypothetical protein P154DRAFT_435018 [Amniculicola lignicola CBS 123094]
MSSIYSPEFMAEDFGASLIGVCCTFIVSLTIFFSLFVVGRYVSRTCRGLDFWVFMPAAYVFCMALCVLVAVKVGSTGRHAIFILQTDAKRMPSGLKISKVAEYSYTAGVACPKIAVLILYVRIFKARPFLIGCYCAFALVAATVLSGFVLSSISCKPFAYFWNPSIPGGKCIDITAAYRYMSFPNIATDVIILVLPILPIMKLQVDLAKKIGLVITFATGSIGILTSIIRTYAFFTADIYPNPKATGVETMMWTAVEPGVYFLAACMPAMSPLKRRFLGDLGVTEFISSRWLNKDKPKRSKSINKTEIKIVKENDFGDTGSLRSSKGDEESLRGKDVEEMEMKPWTPLDASQPSHVQGAWVQIAGFGATVGLNLIQVIK